MATEEMQVPDSQAYGHSLGENTLLSLVSAVMTFIAGTLLTLFQGRFLPVSVFGQVAYAATFSGLVALIPNYGFELLVVREIAQNRFSPARTLINVLCAKTLLLLPTLLLTGIYIRLNRTPAEDASLIWIYLGSFFALSLSRAFNAVSKARNNFRVEAAVYSLQALTMAAGTLFIILVLKIVASTPNAWMALSGRVSGLLLGAILTRRLLGERLRTWPEWPIMRSLLRAGFPFALQAMLATAYFQIDTLFVRNLLGATETGYYQAALRMVVGLNMLASFMTNAFYPRVASSFSQGIAGADSYYSRKMMHVVTLVGCAISLGLFLTAKPLIYAIYGAKMAPSVAVLRVAAFIPLVRFAAAGYGVILISIHRQNVQVIGAGIAMVLIAILNWLFVPRMGYMASVSINLGTNMVVLGIYFTVILRKTHMTFLRVTPAELRQEMLDLGEMVPRMARRMRGTVRRDS